MARRSTQPAAESDQTESDNLPVFDGSQLAMAQWLRDLEAAQHLFDSDVTYFLVTATAVTSQCKTAVLSPEHSLLLTAGITLEDSYSVLQPPPIKDAFKARYLALQQSIGNGEIVHLDANDFPNKPDLKSMPDNHTVAPDRLMQLDMKLRNNLLSLITSKGRRRHYQEATLSGCELLNIFIRDAKAAASAYVQSPYIRKLKAQLNEVRKVTLSKISMKEFDDIRDGIEEINDQLDVDDRMTDVQLCDHYIGLINKLNNPGLRIALEVKLTTSQVTIGDVQSTLTAITQVLTSSAYLLPDQRRVHRA